MGLERIKSCRTGEIYTTVTKEVDGIIVVFFENKIEIHIKPHYLYNNNLHNANDFDVLSCIRTLKKIIKRFGLNPYELFIVNIEYGVNLSTFFEICLLVESLGYHQKNKFITDSMHAFSKKSASIGAQNRFSSHKMIKAYAKSIQFPQYTNGNVFRFEVKSKKSRFINNLNIYTIADLFLPEKYLQLCNSLSEEFERVLFLDHELDLSIYDAQEREKLLHYSNAYTWEGYKKQHRNTFSNNKRKYEILASRSPNGYKSTLTLVLKSKLEKLLSGVRCAESHLL